MKYILLFLLLLCINCTSSNNAKNEEDSGDVYAGPYLGTDFFTITNEWLSPETCELILSTFDGLEAPALGFVWSSFGDNYQCVMRFTDRFKDRPHLLRIHLDDHVCKRNGNCAVTEFNFSLGVSHLNYLLEREEGWLIAKYRARLNSINVFADIVSKDTTRIVVSGGLEEQMSVKAASIVSKLITEVGFESVANPVSALERIGYTFYEIHTSAPANNECIAALDGGDIDFPHKRSFYPRIMSKSELCTWMELNQECLGIFLWSARSQGLGITDKFNEPNSSGYVVPRNRDIDFTEEDSAYMNLLLRSAQNRDFTCLF